MEKIDPDFAEILGLIAHLDGILHRISANTRYRKANEKYSTSHFKPPVAPIILEA